MGVSFPEPDPEEAAGVAYVRLMGARSPQHRGRLRGVAWRGEASSPACTAAAAGSALAARPPLVTRLWARAAVRETKRRATRRAWRRGSWQLGERRLLAGDSTVAGKGAPVGAESQPQRRP